jgi:hypothetical protein
MNNISKIINTYNSLSNRGKGDFRYHFRREFGVSERTFANRVNNTQPFRIDEAKWCVEYFNQEGITLVEETTASLAVPVMAAISQ